MDFYENIKLVIRILFFFMARIVHMFYYWKTSLKLLFEVRSWNNLVSLYAWNAEGKKCYRTFSFTVAGKFLKDVSLALFELFVHSNRMRMLTLTAEKVRYLKATLNLR